MVIDKDNKTISVGTFELVVAINYIERCVEKADRTEWKLAPEVTVRRMPVKAQKTACNRFSSAGRQEV